MCAIILRLNESFFKTNISFSCHLKVIMLSWELMRKVLLVFLYFNYKINFYKIKCNEEEKNQYIFMISFL